MQENLHCNAPVDFRQRERERYFSRTVQIQAGNWIAQSEFTYLSYACEILRLLLDLCNKFLGDSSLTGEQFGKLVSRGQRELWPFHLPDPCHI